MKLISAIVLFSSLLGVFASTPDQVLSDMSAISSHVATMNSNIKSLSTWNLAGAWSVHTSARMLVTTLETATNNAKTATLNPISFDDAQSVLSASEDLRNMVVEVMESLLDVKDTVTGLPVAGAMTLVRQDLEVLKSSTDAYYNAMLGGITDENLDRAMTIKYDLDDAFSAAMSAFSSN